MKRVKKERSQEFVPNLQEQITARRRLRLFPCNRLLPF
jgi:hypothetical protein